MKHSDNPSVFRQLHRHTLGSVVVALALAAAVYTLFVVLPFSAAQVWFAGDQARLFDRAGAILDGELVYRGPVSSQYGVSQPGPAYLYLLAGLFWAAAEDIERTVLVSSAVYAFAIAAISLVTFRLFGSLALALAGPLIVITNFWFFYYLKIVSDLGSPMPMLAFGLWLALEAWAGSGLALVAAVLLLSVGAQAHAAFVPLAAVLGGLTLIGFTSSRRGIPRAPFWVASILALVVWAPVGYELAVSRGGNLLHTLQLVAAGGPTHTLSDVAAFVRTAALEGMLVWPVLTWTLLGASGVLLAVGALLLHRTQAGVWWWTVMLAAAWLAYIWSVLRMPGPLEMYILGHVHVLIGLTFVGSVGVVLVLVRGWNERRSRILALAAAFVLAGLVALPLDGYRRQFAQTDWNAYPLSDQLAIVSALERGRTSAVPSVDAFIENAGLPPMEATRPEPVQIDMDQTDRAVDSFRYLMRQSGLQSRAPEGRPHYRVVARRAYDARKSPSVDAGREVLKTSSYVLEYVPPAN